MSRSAAQVLDELLAISPDGDALPLQPSQDGVWAKWLSPLAGEVSRFEGLAEEMFVEVDPGEAVYLLSDYQRVLGPDPYGRDTVPLTLAEQQALAHSRWTQKWGVRPQDFVAFAASFGIVVSIQEFTLTVVGATIGAELVNHPTQFTWIVNMPAAVLEFATASGSSIGDYLSAFEPSLVQPAIAGRAPAHTNPIFNYA